MKEKKISYIWRLISAFLIASVLFFGAFALANFVSYYNYNGIKEGNDIVKEYLEEMDIYLTKSTCNEDLIFLASERLDEVGKDLYLLEKRFGKYDERVLEQKRLYSELEYKHYLLIKDFREICMKNYTTIFFVYSNEGSLEKESEKVGFILSTYKKEDLQNRFVYSFDANLNMELISNLKIENNLTEFPVTIINDGFPKYIEYLSEIE